MNNEESTIYNVYWRDKDKEEIYLIDEENNEMNEKICNNVLFKLENVDHLKSKKLNKNFTMSIVYKENVKIFLKKSIDSDINSSLSILKCSYLQLKGLF